MCEEFDVRDDDDGMGEEFERLSNLPESESEVDEVNDALALAAELLIPDDIVEDDEPEEEEYTIEDMMPDADQDDIDDVILGFGE